MQLCNSKDPKCLDVGFGEHDIKYVRMETWFHRHLRKNFKDVVGLDIDEELVNEIRSETHYENLYSDDITKLTRNYGKFDMVHLGDVIEHVDERASMMVGLREVLAQEGYLFISTPNPQSYSFIFDVLRQGVSIPNSDHTAWLCPGTMWELCERTGLKIEKIVGTLTTKRSIISKILPSKGSKSFFSGVYIYVIRRA